MTIEIFMMLLTGFSVLTSLVTEAIKKCFENPKTNLLALITALVVGCAGTFLYYQLNGIDFTVNNIIYAILLALASGLVAMVGYDKVKQMIEQFIKGGEE